MKIIRCDTFDRDTVADVLVAENIIDQKEAEIMCDALRDYVLRPNDISYKIVGDDYVLSKGMEDLV